jgi:8-oxo-dGTP pyrophosphatase MutT (NUDIX family)
LSLPKAAVAVIRCLNPEPSILLIERAENPNDPWSGHLAFPGGQRELQDIHLLNTAMRECHEETGLILTKNQWCGIGRHVVAGHYSGRKVLVSPFFFEIEAEIKTIFDENEVKAIHWLKEASFLNLNLHREDNFHPKFPDTNFPYFPIKGKRLWGFTHELLLDYYRCFKKVEI